MTLLTKQTASDSLLGMFNKTLQVAQHTALNAPVKRTTPQSLLTWAPTVSQGALSSHSLEQNSCEHLTFVH